MRPALLAAALVLTTLGGAHAAEPYASLKDRPNVDWTGPYVGGHLGYGWASSGNSWRSPGASIFTWQPDGDIDDDGWVGGGFLGYQRQLGNVVLGIEADFSFARLKGDDSQFAGLVNSLEVEQYGTVRARVGWAHGASMLFLTGGYAFGSISKGDETFGVSFKHNVDGWTIGGGYEAQLGGGWRGRLEYQYIDFGQTETYMNLGSGIYYEHRVDDLSIHVARMALSYGF